jgi:hypothetical protein
MHCSRYRYVKVINEDGAYVTTKVTVKQLRYIPITPRLKWLFLCEETSQQMRWHKKEIRDSEDADIISHPVDAEAWQTLDHFDTEFARDPMSVRLGLSTNGFQPYSCWPVFVMPYNLPPNECLKEGFIFLTLMIPDPKKPNKQMNIFLCPLMEELKELWQGLDAYDSHLKYDFNLRATYLWSIHYYLAYDKFVDWCYMIIITIYILKYVVKEINLGHYDPKDPNASL